MDACKMTKEDFLKVPYRESFNSKEKPFNSLVIIPMNDLHDSGWRKMQFVALDEKDEPIVRIGMGADVLDIDGIGGFGPRSFATGIPKVRPVQGWRIDCLPESGYLRLWCEKHNGITCGNDVSNFEIFYKED